MPQYKITNVSDKDLISEWSLTLFDDEQLAAWEDYKKTTNYTGDPTQPQTVAMRRRMPEFTKLREFVNGKGYGELIEDIRKTDSPNGVFEERVVNRKFVLKANSSIVVNERQKTAFEYLKRREIAQTLKPGEVTPRVHKEGILEITEVEEEVQPVVSQSVAKTIEGAEKPDLTKMNFGQLRSLAQKHELYKPGMKNADLINALQEVL